MKTFVKKSYTTDTLPSNHLHNNQLFITATLFIIQSELL